MIVAAGGVFSIQRGRTPIRWANSALLKYRTVTGHHTKEGGGPTAMRDGKTCGRLCVRPHRRVNCASHRSQAKAVLSTGTHCMCRQVLHRTFVPRTTVADLLIAANNTTTDPRSAGDEEVTNLEARGFDGWDHRRRRALVCVNGGRKLTPLELTRRHGVRHPMALRAQVLPVSKPTVLRLRRDHGGLGMPAQDRTSGQSPGSDAAG